MRVNMIVSLVYLLLGQVDEQEVSRFKNLVEASQASIPEITCIYEGKLIDIELGKELHTFSGSYSRKPNGFTKQTSHLKSTQKPLLPKKTTIATARKATTIYTQLGDSENRSVEIREAVPWDTFVSTGTTLFLLDKVRTLCNDKNFSCNLEKKENIGIYECNVIAFSLRGKPAIREKFWISSSQGGHVLKHEQFDSRSRPIRKSEIRLEKYLVKTETVWIPVELTDFVYFGSKDRKPEFHDKPITKIHFYIIND